VSTVRRSGIWIWKRSQCMGYLHPWTSRFFFSKLSINTISRKW